MSKTIKITDSATGKVVTEADYEDIESLVDKGMLEATSHDEDGNILSVEVTDQGFAAVEEDEDGN